MPELPEVETTRQGISNSLQGYTITQLTVRNPHLRETIASDIATHCLEQEITSVTRRAKYLILNLNTGYVLIHLGMSGHLRLLQTSTPALKHDHVDFTLSNGLILRYNDPRRFGLIQWSNLPQDQHPRLKHLGPEPLSDDFSPDHLWSCGKKRKTTIKALLMNNQVVVGVGNIYATESLFLAGITPSRMAKTLSKPDYKVLVAQIKSVLRTAIHQGGTTLKDFYSVSGKPGYFTQSLQVYGRAGQSCHVCNTIIMQQMIAQRNSFYCPQCQH